MLVLVCTRSECTITLGCSTQRTGEDALYWRCVVLYTDAAAGLTCVVPCAAVAGDDDDDVFGGSATSRVCVCDQHGILSSLRAGSMCWCVYMFFEHVVC